MRGHITALIAVLSFCAWPTPANAHCPPVGSQAQGVFRVWIRVVNVGDVRFDAVGPHQFIGYSSVPAEALADIGWWWSVWMQGDGYGSSWVADGKWKGKCVHLFRGAHSVYPLSPPGNFDGTLTLISGQEVDDEDCETAFIPPPGGCNSNSSGGGADPGSPTGETQDGTAGSGSTAIVFTCWGYVLEDGTEYWFCTPKN